MPQPRLKAQRQIAQEQTTKPLAPGERATMYCEHCGGFHGIDAETRAKWLAWVGVDDDSELAILSSTYDTMDRMLRALGPGSYDRCGGGGYGDLIQAGQDYIDQLSHLLYPTQDDLDWMDVV